MRLLASFVMQGRSQAVMAVSFTAMLMLLFPPLIVVSSAAVALVTLRIGLQDGLLVALLSVVACAILAMLVQVHVLPVVGIMLVLWLPVLVLAWLLRSSRSLAYATTLALLSGVLLIAAQYLLAGDPAAQWHKLLGPAMETLTQGQKLDAEQKGHLLDVMSHWMPGIVAVGFFQLWMASLLLARWWQSLLYNPGGFRSEFYQLMLPQPLAIVAVIVVALLTVGMGGSSPLLVHLAMLLIMAYLLQGLALAHGLRAKLDANPVWLFGMYTLLIIGMHYMVVLLAIIGVFDAFLNFRARIGKGEGSG